MTREFVEEMTELIRQWKPAETDHWFFGRNVPNRRTGNDQSLVWHAHLYPNDEKKAEAWDANCDSRHSRPFDRAGDHLMYYFIDVKNPYKYGLLVIEIKSEPTATNHRRIQNCSATGKLLLSATRSTGSFDGTPLRLSHDHLGLWRAPEL